jgi:hypothetical protein
MLLKLFAWNNIVSFPNKTYTTMHVLGMPQKRVRQSMKKDIQCLKAKTKSSIFYSLMILKSNEL